MNARNDVKRLPHNSLDARPAPAALQLRFAARIDLLVARWLEHRATSVEAAQWLFRSDRTPAPEIAASEPCRFISTLG